MDEEKKSNGYEGWAIVELMGHRRLAGKVSEATIAGTAMLRLDVPSSENGASFRATQFYGGSAIYCLTPTTEDIARQIAAGNQPEPVARWELPPAKGASVAGNGPSVSNEDEDASY